jgi:hypothetical protein
VLGAGSTTDHDFSRLYEFPPLTPCVTNTVFFADFAPQKLRKPLILLVNFKNGRAMPLPQHSTPGHRVRDAPQAIGNRGRERQLKQ